MLKCTLLKRLQRARCHAPKNVQLLQVNMCRTYPFLEVFHSELNYLKSRTAPNGSLRAALGKLQRIVIKSMCHMILITLL